MRNKERSARQGHIRDARFGLEATIVPSDAAVLPRLVTIPIVVLPDDEYTNVHDKECQQVKLYASLSGDGILFCF